MNIGNRSDLGTNIDHNFIPIQKPIYIDSHTILTVTSNSRSMTEIEIPTCKSTNSTMIP